VKNITLPTHGHLENTLTNSSLIIGQIVKVKKFVPWKTEQFPCVCIISMQTIFTMPHPQTSIQVCTQRGILFLDLFNNQSPLEISENPKVDSKCQS
jgi:hypothetical protein